MGFDLAINLTGAKMMHRPRRSQSGYRMRTGQQNDVTTPRLEMLASKKAIVVSALVTMGAFAFFSFAHDGFRTDRSFKSYCIPLLIGLFTGVSAALMRNIITAKTRKSNEFLLDVIESLATALEERDPYTHGHSRRVAMLAVQLGARLGLSFSKMQDLRLCGILHDIGKIGIPDSMLLKTMALTDEEFAFVREHPEKGARILERLHNPRMDRVIDCVKHHHERYDGQGYPDGIQGNDIPLFARILAIADAYDTMVSDRPYRKHLDIPIALTGVRDAAGSQFDPELSALFTAMLRQEGEARLCPYAKECPVFERVGEEEIIDAFETQYCRAGYQACERFRLKDKGNVVSSSLLPNGRQLL